MSSPHVRPLDADLDQPWAEDIVEREFAGRMQARRGELMDPLKGDALVAELDGRAVGLIGWVIGGPFSKPNEAEIRVLVTEPGARGQGAGSALLAEGERLLLTAGVSGAWLVTTNDNIEALAFYQRRGWLVVEILAGAVDEARRTLKPSIGRVAANGIPIRDELVVAKRLSPGV